MTSCLGSSARSRRSRTRSEAVLSRPSFRPRCLSRRWSFMCPLPRARSLPLGVGRAALARSGPSGSAGRGDRHAKGRVAVLRTLPLGVGRTVLVALKSEWQCDRHGWRAQGASGSAPYTATRCRTCRIGTLGPEWQCGSGRSARKGASGSAPYTATRCRTCRIGCAQVRVAVRGTGARLSDKI